MKLAHEFYRLPLRYDVDRLAHEVSLFEPNEWQPHPSGFEGNTSIPLISLNGGINDDFNGPMKQTPFLQRCPYIQQVIASFGEVFGRSRLMRLDGNCEVPEHCDINYHWHNRVRIHIPIITFPEVIFYCGDKRVHMVSGDTWIFDAWKMHKVVNGADKTRVHLVIDTCGSSRFWELVSRSETGPFDSSGPGQDYRFITYESGKTPSILTEQYNAPLVMSPGELDALVCELLDDISVNARNSKHDVAGYTAIVNDFRHDWRSLWSLYGFSRKGWGSYKSLIDVAGNRLSAEIGDVALTSNKASARQTFQARILYAALNTELADQYLGQVRGKVSNFPDKGVKKIFSGKAGVGSPSVTNEKIGRNDQCPCGSGKKYKRCHG